MKFLHVLVIFLLQPASCGASQRVQCCAGSPGPRLNQVGHTISQVGRNHYLAEAFHFLRLHQAPDGLGWQGSKEPQAQACLALLQPLAASLPPISPLHHPDLPETPALITNVQPLAPVTYGPIPHYSSKALHDQTPCFPSPCHGSQIPQEALPPPRLPSPMLSMTPCLAQFNHHLLQTPPLHPGQNETRLFCLAGQFSFNDFFKS